MGAADAESASVFVSWFRGAWVAHLQSALGIIAIIALAWALSEDRRAFSWRLAAGTVALQAAIALLLLKVPVTRDALYGLNTVVTAVTTATNAGTSFVFGYMGSGPTPFAVTNPGNLTIWLSPSCRW
jgi:CNT family concentrative nucleoside transporter